MAITIERATGSDAKEILEFTKAVGSETNNLSYGKEGVRSTVEQEAEYLNTVGTSEKDLFLIARENGELVGTANYSTFSKPRMAHRGEIGISVRKSMWGKGIGTMLMERLLSFAKNAAHSEIVSLEVRSDNDRAKNLYRKFGFRTIGTFNGFFKIDGEFIDFDIMEKQL